MAGPTTKLDLSKDQKQALISHFQSIMQDEEISTPIAAILALTELIKMTNAQTMFELVQYLTQGADVLHQRYKKNPISLDAGCQLFIAFVTLYIHELRSFTDLKNELVRLGREYAKNAKTYRRKIAEYACDFIKDDAVILTHSYSRVVLQALIHAHERRKISVYVTEASPRNMGVKMCRQLEKHGIPCTIVLDSAVAYVMDKVDIVLVGSEAVVESGGLINSVGSYQLALLAKVMNRPFYALAESYKFHRLFPLSQYDLPTHTSETLSIDFNKSYEQEPPSGPPSSTRDSHKSFADRLEYRMKKEEIEKNPEVDYTKPELISLVFSDVGILTPGGVSQYLVGMFAG